MTNGLRREDRGAGRGVDVEVSTPAVIEAGATGGRRARVRRASEGTPAVVRPGRLSIGIVTLWLSVIVLLPLAAVVAKSLDDGARRVLGRGQRPPGRRGAALHADRLADRHGDQRVRGDADRVGARARRVPRQARDQRADRPAVRAADDRRRDHAARALREHEPARDRHRLHADRGRVRAAVRHAAVRRALGPAGAAGARPRDGGGGGVAGRERLDDLPPRSCCRTSCPRSSAAARWPSRAPSASSARSC